MKTLEQRQRHSVANKRAWAFRKKSIEDRFWEKVDKSGDCWLWTAFVSPDGYGKFWKNDIQRGYAANRMSWELTHGEIPDGVLVCHTCDTPLCVKPSHLFLGTPKDNALDCAKKLRQTSRKLTPVQVLEIRASSAQHRQLGVKYGVHETTILAVRRRQTFDWVKETHQAREDQR